MADKDIKFAYSVEQMLELIEESRRDKSFSMGLSDGVVWDMCRRIKALEVLTKRWLRAVVFAYTIATVVLSATTVWVVFNG